ncbi:hypothetical protein OROGR_002511 [Orobanche gracilis]
MWETGKMRGVDNSSYAAFHDEEWGLPVHDDKELFELLSLSTALAELSWPVILSKRHIFRDVFHDFDPIAVSKLNAKKIATPGSPASSLLSEVKLRAIIENARQICKIPTSNNASHVINFKEMGRSSRTLYVDNLSGDIRETGIKDLFCKFEDSPDGYSMYIKGLLMNSTESLLEEVFKQFVRYRQDRWDSSREQQSINKPLVLALWNSGGKFCNKSS